MKICTKCKIAKNEMDFFVKNSSTGRLHAQCKNCYKQHRQTYYTKHYEQNRAEYLQRAKLRREKLRQEFRANMLSYLYDKSCELCGEMDIRVLEFNHINPTQKKFGISRAVEHGYTWQQVLSEIEKCQLLCANCHKKITAEQFGWYKTL